MVYGFGQRDTVGLRGEYPSHLALCHGHWQGWPQVPPRNQCRITGHEGLPRLRREDTAPHGETASPSMPHTLGLGRGVRLAGPSCAVTHIHGKRATLTLQDAGDHCTACDNSTSMAHMQQPPHQLQPTALPLWLLQDPRPQLGPKNREAFQT